ncbi:4-Cys prefix domain-containing protein [Anabaena sp. WA102]|uniref:4-Cys prefix domain-containing protein n=1 Tax=Anabaena sp. WA102 TaxID=1647413 RepID=UPI000AEDCE3C
MSLCINPNCPKPQNPNNILFCETCSSGLLLQDRYRVIVRLGGGGFGDTFEINEVRTNKTKVIKILTDNAFYTFALLSCFFFSPFPLIIFPFCLNQDIQDLRIYRIEEYARCENNKILFIL